MSTSDPTEERFGKVSASDQFHWLHIPIENGQLRLMFLNVRAEHEANDAYSIWST